MSNETKTPVAFYATVKGFGKRSVVAAESPGKARYRVYLAMNSAGFDPQFQEIQIRRAHNLDIIAPSLAKLRRVISEECAEIMYRVEMAAHV